MPKRLRLRSVSEEEAEQVRRLANSRKAPAAVVQRARVIFLMLEDPTLPAGHASLRAGFKSQLSGCQWVHRFNEGGTAGLEDMPRSGKPPIHTEETRSRLIALALQKPRSLGYPFELWTLARLQTAFEEREGVHLSDSTIWEWLAAEGLEWKRQQSWFRDVERHDPDFAEKRGR
jgi:transposase